MKRLFCHTIKKQLPTGLLILFLLAAAAVSAQTISLAGPWQVRLGSLQAKAQSVTLPSTLDDARIGQPLSDTPRLNIATMAHLARKTSFTGKAYYTKIVTIPANWKEKKIFLSLGRVIWKSEVSIDGIAVADKGESLVSEHLFDLSGKLIPGKTHTVTILIDNSNIYPGINIYEKKYPNPDSYEMVHGYTNHTQIKWNGVLGHIRLTARPANFVQQVNIYPDVAGKKLKINYVFPGVPNENIRLHSCVRDLSTKKNWIGRAIVNVTSQELNIELDLDPAVVCWNEFDPKLYQLVTVLQSGNRQDTVFTSFGIRDLQVKDRDLYLNDRRLFIRGNLECVIFPLKGYPPMDIASWKELYRKAKSFGLNSFRFHSWCPPAAAFEAADEVGFYMQVELPHWNLKVGADTASFAFLRREAHRIIEQYGNHPSFMFFAMGNELEGDFKLLNDLVHELKTKDRRHLYATTSFTFQKNITGAPQPEDDFFVTQWTKDGWVRGQGVFNDQAPDFSKDFTSTSSNITAPLITHEIGQYSVYPDISEISKYTGNLAPNNFIAVRDDLKKKGRLSYAPAFLRASGKLATLLYKEEIERALKTKEFDGFQLLQLQDFPGQGTALIGVLNAFWQPKGFVTAREFRKFNGPLIPLIRYPKAVYQNDETFEADVELANFYQPLQKAAIAWRIRYANGKILANGSFPKQDFPVGNTLPAGKIRLPLKDIAAASQLAIEVNIEGTSALNSWKIWVYPATAPLTAQYIVVTDSYSDAMAALSAGKKVLLSPRTDTLKGIEGRFVPVFWSPVHFPDQPGTMGQLIKSTHKAFQYFPTDEHTDWQWWDLIKKSKTLVVPDLKETAILVRVIDNFVGNGNLTNLFEIKVGDGKLLFSAIDLISDLENRPQARQLRYSLLEYMKTAAFNPANVVSADWVRQLIR